jgi:ribonuclease HI
MARFQRRVFRGQKVWAEVGADGQLAADPEGRVEIRYKLEDTRAYRANGRNLEVIAGAEPVDAAALPPAAAAGGATPRPARPRRKSPAPAPAPAPGPVTDGLDVPPIIAYTDGACTGNPGPMGIGVVLVAGDRRKEISEYLGVGTNNIAELTAMLRALEAIKDRDRPVLLHSDSNYAIGVVGKGWKAKANQELVARIRALGATFRALRFVKVEGHAGVPENERCDELAREAITGRG